MSPPDTGPSPTAREDACPYMEEKTAVLRQFARRYTNEIVRELVIEPDPMRFGELQERLDAPPDTLSTRLRELAEAGLVSRRSYDEIPPRVEYAPTPELREFAPVYDALTEWVVRHGDPS